MNKIRSDWKLQEIKELYQLPFFDLLYKAHTIHLDNFPDKKLQISVLASIKTGKCSEDCGYCAQSIHHQTKIKPHDMLSLEEVLKLARQAKEQGADRFCMASSGRNPTSQDFPKILAMVSEVKKLGLETCMSLGLLNDEQTLALKRVGLDFYNHNIDTSPEFYQKIITTHSFNDRLATIKKVRAAGIKVCCGGILGLGETVEERANFLTHLANLVPHPESVPINHLVPISGTPLAGEGKLNVFEFIRTIAVARIILPKTDIRLAAGRSMLSQEAQAWCFFAGANSIFAGKKLLTVVNTEQTEDEQMFRMLNIKTQLCQMDVYS